MPNHQELLEILLKNRGIKKEDRDKFLNPSYENDLYDPYLLKDMELATVRLFEAVSNNEKIVIYSDYDADGIPAAVILHDFLNQIEYKNFFVYIPHRHDEGYGLHADAIDEFIKDGVNLIITLDLGITAISEIAKAKIDNIDTIVFDHHLPKLDENGEQLLPKAVAIVDPKRSDCSYPDENLCGAGLSFKFIQALILKYGEYWKIKEGWEKWLLDMAGVATVSDQVPLLNENRAIASYGLRVLRKTKREGLKELFYKSGISLANISEEDISFTLAPRINVASRMANPMIAFELLSTTDIVKAKTLADMLDKINSERKVIVAHTMKEVKGILNKRFEDESYKEKPFIVIGNPKWHVGVLGLIASKITEEYKKSVFVWGGEEDVIRGSCRGYGEVNLVQVMSSLPEGSLLEYGGHKGAGGFSVSREEIHFLEERIDALLGKSGGVEEELMIDASITIDDVTEENYKVIEKLAPFGMGNPKPTFIFKNLKISEVKEFGKEKNHLELTFKNSRGRNIKAISFFKDRESFGTTLKPDMSIDMIANFERNNFAGKDELRLRIVNII